MKNHALILLVSSLALHASQFSTFGKAVWKEVESAPFATTSKHRFEKHQYASTRFSLGNDGKVTAITTFENGKKLDGDHFYCRIELFDAATNRIAVTRQEAGLNAAGLGSPKKKTKRSVMKLRADKSTNIKFVRFTYGHFNWVDDNKFWDNVKKTALVVGEIAYAIESGDFAVLMEDYADSPLCADGIADGLALALDNLLWRGLGVTVQEAWEKTRLRQCLGFKEASHCVGLNEPQDGEARPTASIPELDSPSYEVA